MAAMARKTPTRALSPVARPDMIQPMHTMVQVLTCPTTVLDTGPVWATMKNCDMLIREAKSPDLKPSELADILRGEGGGGLAY